MIIDPGYEIRDGVPHMTYQRPGSDLNFAWDGLIEHPIMVCPGGYAEPPQDVIDIPAGTPQHLISLPIFMGLCEVYLEENHGRIRGSEETG